MSVVYPLAKQKLLKGDLDLDGTVKVLAVDTDYTYDAAHDFLNDVPSGARLGTAATLASKTFTDGVFNAATVSYATVSSPDVIAAFIGYLDTGSEATSTLIWYADTAADQTPISYAGDGVAISVSWPFGYIFRL